jgi:exodeoxyribonuclease VII large subunit
VDGDGQRNVYSIREVTRLIKTALETRFGAVWVEGELSNVSQPASGHLYFTIKDAHAQLSAVMFRGSQRGLAFKPRDGMVVQAHGEISVYERSGRYQIIVRQLEEGGKGALQARFEALKEKLRREGLFDAARKRPIPLLPQHVAVVTSPTGAAIRDILNVIRRRFPNLHVVVAPTPVQGAGAAESIAAAIDLANKVGGFDVLIVGRGGGSIEDLWCFNEEVVARAIARSAIPVIAAVGHEIDFTIADFVADLRAPTPSAAAELVVGRKDAFEARIAALEKQLAQLLRVRCAAVRARLTVLARHYAFREPANRISRDRQRIEALEAALRQRLVGSVNAVRQRVTLTQGTMRYCLVGGVREVRQRLDENAARIGHRLALRRQLAGERLTRYRLQLRALDPRGVLKRGYTLTRTADGRVLGSVKGLAAGERLVTEFRDGQVVSTADSVTPHA